MHFVITLQEVFFLVLAPFITHAKRTRGFELRPFKERGVLALELDGSVLRRVILFVASAPLDQSEVLGFSYFPCLVPQLRYGLGIYLKIHHTWSGN